MDGTRNRRRTRVQSKAADSFDFRVPDDMAEAGLCYGPRPG